jgi:hypothetical protein
MCVCVFVCSFVRSFFARIIANKQTNTQTNKRATKHTSNQTTNQPANQPTNQPTKQTNKQTKTNATTAGLWLLRKKRKNKKHNRKWHIRASYIDDNTRTQQATGARKEKRHRRRPNKHRSLKTLLNGPLMQQNHYKQRQNAQD